MQAKLAIFGFVISAVLLAPLFVVWFSGWSASDTSTVPVTIDWRRLATSVFVVGVAALLAVIAGFLAAWLFVLTDFPRPRIWAVMVLIPLICPPTVWSLAQCYCYGAGGLAERWLGDGWRPWYAAIDQGHFLSTTLVFTHIYAPLAMLIVGQGFSRLHSAGLETAWYYVPAWRRLPWVLGATRRELLASVLLIFALGLGNFAVPHVMQCRTYVVDVYFRVTSYLDHPGALTVSAPLLIIVATAALTVALTQRGASAVGVSTVRMTRIRLGPYRFVAVLLVVSYLVLTIGLPVGALFSQCGSVSQFLDAARDAYPETLNTITFSVLSAVFACAAGIVVGAWAATQPKGPAIVLAIAPLGIPPLIIALTYAHFYHREWLPFRSVVSDSGLLFVLGLTARTWPFAAILAWLGFRRFAPAWDESSHLARFGVWKRWRLVKGPLLVDFMAAAMMIAFIIASGELEISQMLCAPGHGSLALRLFTFLHFGPTYVAASLAVVQLFVALLPVTLFFLLSNRRLRLI